MKNFDTLFKPRSAWKRPSAPLGLYAKHQARRGTKFINAHLYPHDRHAGIDQQLTHKVSRDILRQEVFNPLMRFLPFRFPFM